MKHRCPHCKKEFVFKLPAWQQRAIRAFKGNHPWVKQYDLGKLFGLSTTRISEICRGYKKAYTPKQPKEK